MVYFHDAAPVYFTKMAHHNINIFASPAAVIAEHCKFVNPLGLVLTFDPLLDTSNNLHRSDPLRNFIPNIELG